MPRVLFLTIHRPQRSPSQRFRFEQYLTFLKKNGFEYDWSFILDEEDDKVFYQRGNYNGKFKIFLKSTLKRIIETIQTQNYDIVFIQRECYMLGTSFFERMFSKKAKVIFDFDDAIWLPNVSSENQKLAFLKNPKKTSSIIKAANLVLAGNDFLASFASKFNGNVSVFPTTIDTENLHNQQKVHQQKEEITIGWTGSFTTLKYLKIIEPMIKDLTQKFNLRFMVICNGYPSDLDLDGVHYVPWSLKTEISSLLEFDIGIMPLSNSIWAEGKCGFKILQYMGLGIPCVASPVGVNKAIITHSVNGFLADSEEEWIDLLSALITSVKLRKQIGKAGRETVERKYSVKANKENYLQLFRNLVTS